MEKFNVKNMERMFHGCNSLKSLPNISYWNTYKVENVFCMFSGCESLISLSDI